MQINKNLVLFGVFLLSLILALYRIQDCRLWIDEFFSINIAQRPLSDIWTLSPHPGKFYWNTMPPLYETILHFFWDISGKNIFLPRILSLFFHLCALYFMFRLAVLVFDRKVASIAVFFASINVSYVFFSKMIRCYPFLNMLAILSLYLFLRIVKRSDFRPLSLISLFFVNACILYTFYFGSFVILTEILLSIFLFRRQVPARINIWLVATFLPFLPWTAHLFRDLYLENVIRDQGQHPNIFETIFFRFSQGIFYDSLLFFVYSIIFATVFIYGAHLARKKDERGIYVIAVALFMLITVFAVNLATIAVASIDYARARYSFIFVFPFFILTAFLISNLPKFFKIGVFAFVFALSLKSLNAYVNLPVDRFWPAPIALLSEEARKFPVPPGEKVIIEIETDLYMPLFVYYFFGPELFRRVSYPNLWSSYKMLKHGIGQYKIVYNIAYLNKHPLFSVGMLREADWLFLFYADGHQEYWGTTFRQAYEDKLKSRGLEGCLVPIANKATGSFNLEIYKIKK